MRNMTIESAIRWAVVEELPKDRPAVDRFGFAPQSQGAAYVAMMAGQLGAVVASTVNQWGVVPDESQFLQRGPHPDAVRIGEALLSLDGIQPAGMEDWDAFEDLEGLNDDPIAGPLLARARMDARHQGGAALAMTRQLSGLMVQRAVLGPPTGWEIGEVECVMECAHGKPLWFRKVRRPAVWNAAGEVVEYETVEVDGRNPKTRRPYDDAYRKHRLEPDPLGVALARAEWQVWRAALDVLQVELDGRLEAIALLPSRMPWRPWVEPVAKPARVLESVNGTTR